MKIIPQINHQDIIKKLQDTVDDSVTSWNQVPHHSAMLNVDKAVQRFMQAINNGESILFVHDSDADGLGTYMLSYIFFQFFKYPHIEILITDRHNGYGFVPKYLNDRIDKLPHLVITADNGITSIDACIRAKELGVDVIITDHHQVDSKRGLPHAIVIDPQQDACNFPYPDINGTFVYWYFLSAIAELANTQIDMHREFLPELCLTTISDVMPLTGINRFIVKEGLKVFNNHHRQWVQTFFKVFGKPEVTAEDLAFNLIPAINVTSRLTNAEESAMFLTRDNYQESYTWLQYIKSLNDVRKSKQENLMTTITNFYSSWLERSFILIPGENFEKGILGPTAGRLAQTYKKPVIVVSKNKAGDVYSGSGRSTGSINLLELVKDNPYVINERTGGHKAACGVSFKVENLNNFFLQLEKDTNQLSPELYKDETKESFGYLKLRDIDYQLLKDINKFQPFGQAFQKPSFITKGKFTKILKIGKQKNHYTIEIEDGLGCKLRAVWFFFTEELKKNINYVFRFTINKDDFKNDDPEAIVLHIEEIIDLGEYILEGM